MSSHDHDEVTCEPMWDFIVDNLLPGTPRYCCVCEGHNCPEALAERVKSGLPPPEKSWCTDVYLKAN